MPRRKPTPLRPASLPFAAVAVLLAVLTPACKSAAQREAEGEVARIAQLVDALRDAPNNAKETPLEELRRQTCSAPAACELQQICVQAYALHGRAIETTMRVRQAMRDGTGAVGAAQDLLDLTERDLAKAKTMMDRCVSLEGELARAAGL